MARRPAALLIGGVFRDSTAVLKLRGRAEGRVRRAKASGLKKAQANGRCRGSHARVATAAQATPGIRAAVHVHGAPHGGVATERGHHGRPSSRAGRLPAVMLPRAGARQDAALRRLHLPREGTTYAGVRRFSRPISATLAATAPNMLKEAALVADPKRHARKAGAVAVLHTGGGTVEAPNIRGTPRAA